jgi:hypothetical protein
LNARQRQNTLQKQSVDHATATGATSTNASHQPASSQIPKHSTTAGVGQPQLTAFRAEMSSTDSEVHVKAFVITGTGVAALVSTLLAAPAHAQTAPAEQPTARGVEITPYLALGSVRSSRIGAAIAFPVTPDLSIETELGYRRGEGGLHAFSSSANLLYHLPQIGCTVPYLAAGAGLEEYGAAFAQPDGRIVTLPGTALTVNAGGGIKLPVDDRWGMRVDGRWYKAFGRQASSEHWRIANGISFGAGKR